MADAVARQPGASEPGFWQRTADFLRGVRVEMKKVVWPDVPTVRQATIAILIFVLLLGLVIAAMDWVFSLILVKGIPAIFAGR